MAFELEKLRNIGISAHIDSGKTTLTERILFYTDRIHAIHDVRGKDGVGAKMDSMELEKERGITIQSAATHVEWDGYPVNIVDTPGHVDFTVEVERSLRVLDGAILVLCATSGVQSQSITVDRQMKRYEVPRIAFINKCDRAGANPYRVTEQLRDKLNLNAHMMQIPVGLEDQHSGVVDLLTMKAYYFDGDNGEKIREEEIPAELAEKAEEKREELIDELSMFNDDIAELHLEGEEIPLDVLIPTIRKAVISLDFVPVFMGSAYKNKGVQPVLNAVRDYLPSPLDITNMGIDIKTEEEIMVKSEPKEPVVLYAFKLTDDKYGQLTYVRIYRGELQKGDEIVNMRTGKKIKVGRLIRMNSDDMEQIEKGYCGDVVALFGVDCASGDTFCAPGTEISMTSMHVPEPVISLAIAPTSAKSQDNLAKALNRFTKEDPTFQTYLDDESNETIISGMGELHLQVYIQRMEREYGVELDVGQPQVAYRETIQGSQEFDYTHKKQTGGSGQYGRVVGTLRRLEDTDEVEEKNSEHGFAFANEVKGGNIPTEFMSAVEAGFKDATKEGTMIGAPVVDVHVTVTDGDSHNVDSSDKAFKTAAINAFKQAYSKIKKQILEPIMKVSVEGPSEFQGTIIASLNQRRGMIKDSSEEGNDCYIDAEVPLSEMFGYSTDIRSLTQGKAEFTMEFEKYGPVPKSVMDELIAEYQKKRAEGKS
ncbi:MAG: elongation factor G [Fibrobacterota bacterium]